MYTYLSYIGYVNSHKGTCVLLSTEKRTFTIKYMHQFGRVISILNLVTLFIVVTLAFRMQSHVGVFTQHEAGHDKSFSLTIFCLTPRKTAGVGLHLHSPIAQPNRLNF